MYSTTHTIGQIGTQRFPEGVLLMTIRSWMCWDCITLVKAQEKSVSVQVPLAAESALVTEKRARAAGLFKLTPASDDDKAHLDVLSATRTYADRLGFFDVGLKLAYHVNSPKKRQKKDSRLL